MQEGGWPPPSPATYWRKNAAVPSPTQFAAALKPLLNECGYTGTRLATGCTFGDKKYPLVGFATKPWDFDSACIAVVETDGQPEEAVGACRELGAPIVWVRHNGTADWWVQRDTIPTRFDSKPIDQFVTLVRRYKDDLHPLSVYRAKALGRLPGAKQLDFVDVGLLPLLRETAGEKLGGLVEEMTRATLRGLGQRNPSAATLRDVFTRVFRLLAGKILKDKGVGGFSSLDLEDPLVVLTAVGRHYNAAHPATRLSREWKDALKEASSLVARFGNVSVVSPETLAYIYEHTLVSEPLRKKLGIHATPPYLVDYIVWQLYDWIREIPADDRHVFEPASGHAPFLLAAMRMLRLEKQGEPDSQVHAYLKSHIHGVEIDPFAREEIARLQLTLADIPSPNGWDLKPNDMYASDVLAVEAKRCRILLSNPPYERFKNADKRRYRQAGFPVQHRKAVELLDRTLRHLAPGAVFGVVVPQGVLHNTEAREVRALLLSDFEIREVCLFADKLFEEGEAETAVLLGRRQMGANRRRTLTYRRIREDSIGRFAENYSADSEHVVSMDQFDADRNKRFHVPDLPEVWAYLNHNPKLGSVAAIGQGFSFAEKGLIAKARKGGKRKTSDAVPAILDGVQSIPIWRLPQEVWLSPSRTPVLTWRSGDYTGKPQVLVNYVRVMRGPWRIKALLDPEGHAVTNTYSTVRPKDRAASVTFLWALLNSPLANAFAYCHTFQRHIYDSLLALFPLPNRWREHVPSVVSAADEYLRFVREPEDFRLQEDGGSAVWKALLNLDAAVMRAYGLPLRLERAVLDLFRLPSANKRRRQRKGVGCVFGDYFPADFESLVPLHKFISPAYRNSTVEKVAARMKPGESATVLEALRAASEAF